MAQIRLRDHKGQFVTLEGWESLQRKLEKRSGVYADGIARGLVKAGLLLQRYSQQIVPVEFTPLKESANTRKEGSGIQTVVTVSYGTNYAVYVHENPFAYHKPPTRYKYLEEPLRTRRQEMQRVVLKEARQG